MDSRGPLFPVLTITVQSLTLKNINVGSTFPTYLCIRIVVFVKDVALWWFLALYSFLLWGESDGMSYPFWLSCFDFRRNTRFCSFSNLSVTSPTSQLIPQSFRRFTYVTAHSPILLLFHLRHSSFSNPSFASPTSQALHLTSPGEPPMMNEISVEKCWDESWQRKTGEAPSKT